MPGTPGEATFQQLGLQEEGKTHPPPKQARGLSMDALGPQACRAPGHCPAHKVHVHTHPALQRMSREDSALSGAGQGSLQKALKGS